MLNAKRNLTICLLVTLTSCASWPRPRDGVVLDNHFGIVQNGLAYDKASVDVSSYRRLVLPADAALDRGGQPGKLDIYMEKTLSFLGHPPASMSIRKSRKKMGCACRAEGDSLTVATYGEWDSHIEGGASMRLLFVVPESIEIETDESLSGEDSKGLQWNGVCLTEPKDGDMGYWVGPASPTTEWYAIPDVPDADLTLHEEAP
ncbi:MAG: hypothetical protein HQ582_20075 [Planctomycetes bacterium]|nr:hypothetical protein [Planctomycetota bacterium]